MLTKFKLFTPGPVNFSEKIESLKQVDEIGHRETEFTDLYGEVKSKLLKVFKADDKYGTVIVGGSGTSALETTLSSVVELPLIISNGSFGERMIEMCDIYDISTYELKYKWGEYPNLKEIEDIIKSNNIKEVCMVYVETSTGMLNPVKEVGKLCKKYNKTFIVDCVCSVGEELDIKEFNIDFCITSSNKGIGAPPSVGIICYNKSKIFNLKTRSFYLSLKRHIDFGKINQTPTTPQIPLIKMLNDTLDDLLKEGIDNRIKRYKENGDLLKLELLILGLKFKLKEHQSNLLVNVIIPKGFTYRKIHNKLKEKGYIIYPGKEQLNDIMQIANMGSLNKEKIKEFIKILGEIIKPKRIIEVKEPTK